ncbi:MAG: hypothetical protein ABIZ50_00060 [Solirubrobacterales bacterium]
MTCAGTQNGQDGFSPVDLSGHREMAPFAGPFRTEVYSALVEAVTGVELGGILPLGSARIIDSATVAEMADAFDKVDLEALATRRGWGEFDLERLLALREFFVVCREQESILKTAVWGALEGTQA